MRFLATAAVIGSLAGVNALLAQPSDPAPERDPFDMPSYQEPAQSWRDIQDPIERARCEQEIRKARAEAGKPEIERETADAEEPLLIAAVDQKLNGCSVLVMKQDTSDVRPLPARPEGPVTIEPAN
ncbi:MAG: hypothetical protein MK010_10750 [Erythrobacter sp.]|nr:hypothetical protein [Erythrobacter sp.]